MIIGFCGYKRAGKNEAANALLVQGYQLCAFADALKAELTTRMRRTCIAIADDYYLVDPLRSDAQKIALLLQDKPPTFRRLLQEYGTEVRRGDDDNYWVRQLETKFALTPYRERNFAVTDVRFPNEAKMIHHFEGRLIYISNLNPPNVDDHASEQPTTLDYDMEIFNGGTIDSLHSAVRAQVALWAQQAERKR